MASRATETLDQQKRKRTQSNFDTDSSMSPTRCPPSPTKSNKAPRSRAPPQVKVDLPRPSPKRVRHDSDDESIKSIKSRNPAKSKSTSTTFSRVVSRIAESPSGSRHSPKAQKPASSALTNDEGDFDDGASVADSVISTTSGKVRRNESERIEYFKNQPECGKIEPHAVECLQCLKNVNLGRKQSYTVRPWEIHRARCDQRPAVVAGGKEDDTAQFPRRLTEEERKAALEGDKQVEVVEEHRVLCRRCQKWIALSGKHKYTSSNWMKHKIHCIDAIPSSHVAAAKRKLLLVNDSQAKGFDCRRVDCALCDTSVVLKGEGDYNLACWEDHKAMCNGRSSDGVNSIPFPGQSSRPPASSASSTTDQTVIASRPDSPSGLKRSRDDLDAADERPTTRARTDSDQGDDSGMLGWFMLPFQAFARGFRESLKNSPT